MVSGRLTPLLAALGMAASALQATPVLAQPAIASEWTDMQMSQKECFARGEKAIARLGFGNLERTRFSRYGTKGEYTVAVRCIEERKLILFLGGGPDRKQAQTYQIELFEQFEKP
jgi:hypothetical protein